MRSAVLAILLAACLPGDDDALPVQPQSGATPWTFGSVEGPDAAADDAGFGNDAGVLDGGPIVFDSNVGPGGFVQDAGVFIDGPPPDVFEPPQP